MGDVLAYSLLGETQYAMFAFDITTGRLGLWDMNTKRSISIRGLQSMVMGFFQFDKETDNFKLNMLFGNSSDAEKVIGSTLEFNDFPAGWGAGNNAHIGFSTRSKLNCGWACGGIAFYSGAQIFKDIISLVGREAFKSATKSAASAWTSPPVGIVIGVTIFAVDMMLNLEPDDPYVIIKPGTAPAGSPPTLDLGPFSGASIP
jgi:hypothetical protein